MIRIGATHCPTNNESFFLPTNFSVNDKAEQETQGISVLESWSMDVPTIIWNPGYFHIKGMNIVCSSSPNMLPQMGLFFRDFNDFIQILLQMEKDIAFFTPRKYVLESMTDKYTSANLLNLLYAEWTK